MNKEIITDNGCGKIGTSEFLVYKYTFYIRVESNSKLKNIDEKEFENTIKILKKRQ